MPKQFPLWKALVTVGIMALVLAWAAETRWDVESAFVATFGAGALTAGVLMGINPRRD